MCAMIKGKVLYVMHFFYSHISSFFFLPIYLTASKRRGKKKKRVLMCGCRPPKEAKLRSPKIKTVSKDRKKCPKASAMFLGIRESSNKTTISLKKITTVTSL